MAERWPDGALRLRCQAPHRSLGIPRLGRSCTTRRRLRLRQSAPQPIANTGLQYAKWSWVHRLDSGLFVLVASATTTSVLIALLFSNRQYINPLLLFGTAIGSVVIGVLVGVIVGWASAWWVGEKKIALDEEQSLLSLPFSEGGSGTNTPK